MFARYPIILEEHIDIVVKYTIEIADAAMNKSVFRKAQTDKFQNFESIAHTIGECKSTDPVRTPFTKYSMGEYSRFRPIRTRNS